MHRCSLALIAALLCSVPASAGLNIEAPATYTPGDLITLTLTGDSEGRTAAIIRALLIVEPNLELVSGAAGMLYDSNSSFYWSQTAEVGTCGPGGLPPDTCTAVDAFEATVGVAAFDLLPSTLSTWHFDTTHATGDLYFSLDPDGAGFFGLPGTTAVVAFVPEPATALLLAVGLVTLRWRAEEAGRCIGAISR